MACSIDGFFSPCLAVIFVDGGHEYSVAKADLQNFKRHSHSASILIMDDLNCQPHPWCVEPQQAWDELIASGQVVEKRKHRWKQKVSTSATEEVYYMRGFSVGQYTHAAALDETI